MNTNPLKSKEFVSIKNLSYNSSPPKSTKKKKSCIYRIIEKDSTKVRSSRRLSMANELPMMPTELVRLLKRPRYYLSRLPETARRLITLLMTYEVTHKGIVCPSYKTLATQLGVTETTIKRSLNDLERLGVAQRTTRPNRTCLFTLSGIFWSKPIIKKLKSLFPVLMLIGNLFQFEYVLRQDILWDIFNIKKVRLGRLYSNMGTNQPDPVYNFITKGLIMKNTQNVIELINELVPLSDLGKAKLSVFPEKALFAAYKELKQKIDRNVSIISPFGMLMTKCKDLAPMVDTSHQNPLFKDLQKRHGFNLGDSPILNKVSQFPKKSGFTQVSPTKRIRPVGDYDYHNDIDSDKPVRPAPGEPLLFEHINEYSKRRYGREAYPGKTGPATELSSKKIKSIYPDISKYDADASRSISEICDDWESKWLLVKKKIDKGREKITPDMRQFMDHKYVGKCLQNMIFHHFELSRRVGLTQTIDYIHDLIFTGYAPASIMRGTIVSETTYFTFLSELFNYYSKMANPDHVEKSSEGIDHHNTRDSNPT